MPWVLQAPCSVGMPFTGGAHSPSLPLLLFQVAFTEGEDYYKRFLPVPVASPGSRNAILPFSAHLSVWHSSPFVIPGSRNAILPFLTQIVPIEVRPKMPRLPSCEANLIFKKLLSQLLKPKNLKTPSILDGF